MFQVLQSDAKRAVQNLSSLSNEELNEILSNDDRLEEILSGLSDTYIKEIQNEKEQLLANNNSMAEFNLSREPELVEGREKLQSLYEECERLTKCVDEKTEEFRKKGGDISLETTLALLQTAASETEEDSDKCAKKFLDSELDIDDFLDEFRTKRNLMHMRLVKAEKLSKILQRDPSLSNIPNYINAPPVNVNSHYFPGVPNLPPPVSSVPYPVGPLHMPMPSGGYFQNHY